MSNTIQYLPVTPEKRGGPYTFKDWLIHKFYQVCNWEDKMVLNDSSNYLWLYHMGEMELKELNKIKNAQLVAYKYIIKCTLHQKELELKEIAKRSLDFIKVLRSMIDSIEHYIKLNHDLFDEVNSQKEENGILIGAKYLVPEQYIKSEQNIHIDVFTVCNAPQPWNFTKEGTIITYPTPNEMEYPIMEFNIHWKKKLEVELEKLIIRQKRIAKPSFKIIDNVSTINCYNTLRTHHFIDPNTSKKDFTSIFSGQKIRKKINWIGNLKELSRFAFLLQTDTEVDKSTRACFPLKNWHVVTSNCFVLAGDEIFPEMVLNSNRKLRDESRYKLLLIAIKHLKKS